MIIPILNLWPPPLPCLVITCDISTLYSIDWHCSGHCWIGNTSFSPGLSRCTLSCYRNAYMKKKECWFVVESVGHQSLSLKKIRLWCGMSIARMVKNGRYNRTFSSTFKIHITDGFFFSENKAPFWDYGLDYWFDSTPTHYSHLPLRHVLDYIWFQKSKMPMDRQTEGCKNRPVHTVSFLPSH